MDDKLIRVMRERTEAVEKNTEASLETNKQLEAMNKSVHELSGYLKESAKRREEEAIKTRIAQENIQKEQMRQTLLAQYSHRFTIATHRLQEYEETYFAHYSRHEKIREKITDYFFDNDYSTESTKRLLYDVRNFQRLDTSYPLTLCMESILEYELGNYEASELAKKKSYELNFGFSVYFYILSFLLRENIKKSYEFVNEYFEGKGAFGLNQFHYFLIRLYLSGYYSEEEAAFEAIINNLVKDYDVSDKKDDTLWEKVIYNTGVNEDIYPNMKEYVQNFEEIKEVVFYTDLIKKQSDFLDMLKTIDKELITRTNEIESDLNWLIHAPVNSHEKKLREQIYLEKLVIHFGGNESLVTGYPNNNNMYFERSTNIGQILVALYKKCGSSEDDLLVKKKILRIVKKDYQAALEKVCEKQQNRISPERYLKASDVEFKVNLKEDIDIIRPVIKKKIARMPMESSALPCGCLTVIVILLAISPILKIINYNGSYDVTNDMMFVLNLFFIYFGGWFFLRKITFKSRMMRFFDALTKCQDEFNAFERRQELVSAVDLVEKLNSL